MQQQENKYKFDRTAFKASTFEDADHNLTYWRSKSYRERLEAAYYLISHAYDICGEYPRLDKTVFHSRKFAT